MGLCKVSVPKHDPSCLVREKDVSKQDCLCDLSWKISFLHSLLFYLLIHHSTWQVFNMASLHIYIDGYAVERDCDVSMFDLCLHPHGTSGMAYCVSHLIWDIDLTDIMFLWVQMPVNHKAALWDIVNVSIVHIPEGERSRDSVISAGHEQTWPDLLLLYRGVCVDRTETGFSYWS